MDDSDFADLPIKGDFGALLATSPYGALLMLLRVSAAATGPRFCEPRMLQAMLTFAEGKGMDPDIATAVREGIENLCQGEVDWSGTTWPPGVESMVLFGAIQMLLRRRCDARQEPARDALQVITGQVLDVIAKESGVELPGGKAPYSMMRFVLDRSRRDYGYTEGLSPGDFARFLHGALHGGCEYRAVKAVWKHMLDVMGDPLGGNLPAPDEDATLGGWPNGDDRKAYREMVAYLDEHTNEDDAEVRARIVAINRLTQQAADLLP